MLHPCRRPCWRRRRAWQPCHLPEACAAHRRRKRASAPACHEQEGRGATSRGSGEGPANVATWRGCGGLGHGLWAGGPVRAISYPAALTAWSAEWCAACSSRASSSDACMYLISELEKPAR
eukprot:3151036-Prymnesium_polylepis.1